MRCYIQKSISNLSRYIYHMLTGKTSSSTVAYFFFECVSTYKRGEKDVRNDNRKRINQPTTHRLVR